MSWTVKALKADYRSWGEQEGVSPIIARLARNRGITTVEELHRYLYGGEGDLYSPALVPDIDRAADVVYDFISNDAHIRIIGDYDVDGVCSSRILEMGFRALGAKNVDVDIPHRIMDGYGLNARLIQCAADNGVALIVTCDNGISAAPEIEAAREAGMTVVVTDHHEVPYDPATGEEILPPAAAVVDPKRADSLYPYREICGAVVAFKLIERMTEVHSVDLGSLRDDMLQLAALATVCDVMPLCDENRLLVKCGLALMRHSPCLPIKALAMVNGIEPGQLSVYHLGFVLGPCLNATGRLDTAKRALELLQQVDEDSARLIAGELRELNDSRKDLTNKGVAAAEEAIAKGGMDEDPVLVIYLPGMHESLAGIVAGKVRERYNRPTFVITDTQDGAKGSGRSIEAYDMYAALTSCKDLYTKYGGHHMAGGFSLPVANIDEMRKRLNTVCVLSQEDMTEAVSLDMELPFRVADLALAEELAIMEPFGNGNPKPLFGARGIIFSEPHVMGASRNVARIPAMQDGRRYEMVLFGTDVIKEFLETVTAGSRYTVAYRLDVNEYRGNVSAQLVLERYMVGTD